MDACIGCGDEYVPTNSRQLYCTEKCRRATHRAAQKPPPNRGVCRLCSEGFIGKRKHAKWCSDRCRDRARRLRERGQAS